MIEKQVIQDFLTDLANRKSPIGDDDSLLATKVLDSLGIAELVVFLEDHYDVVFDSDELIPDNLDTINAIVGFLYRKGVS